MALQTPGAGRISFRAVRRPPSCRPHGQCQCVAQYNGGGTPNTGLNYAVTFTAALDCGGPSGSVDLASTGLIDGDSFAGFDLVKGADALSAGSMVNLCFTVSAGAQTLLEPNKTTVATW